VKLDTDVMAIPVRLARLVLLASVALQEKEEKLLKAVKDLLVRLVFEEDLELMVMLANLDQMGPAGTLDLEEILEILAPQES
jgi:hypothetical protein